MSNLGNAYVLAMAIFGSDKELPLIEVAENLYHAVDVLEFGYDERKADLYAQLAEQLTEGTGFKEAVNIIEIAMDNTDRRYPHG